jgi:hypothetical protein
VVVRIVNVFTGGEDGSESMYRTVSYSPARSIRCGFEEVVDGSFVKWGILVPDFCQAFSRSAVQPFRDITGETNAEKRTFCHS